MWCYRNAPRRARPFRHVCRYGVIAWLILLPGSLLHAHDPGISTVQGVVSRDAVELTTGFAPADAEQLVPAAGRSSERMTEDEFVKVRKTLDAVAPQLWELRVGDRLVSLRDVSVE